MTAWGWAVIKNNKVIACGCIKTAPDYKKKRIRKSDDTLRRVSEINSELSRIMFDYNVNYILSEAPHGSQNAQAAVMVGMVAGILQTMADLLSKPIEWFSEMESKKALLGKKSASKNETIQMIKKLYPETKFKNVKYFDEAVADAVSIYFCACKLSPTIKMMSNVPH
jgi:Holliday junction resolvasome RuvABC endonuclease subunit